MDGKLFYAGYSGVRSFRIPSLLYTKRGTRIAAADARLEEGCDNPNRIDKVIRRSFDQGRSWGSMIVALEMQGRGRQGCAAIDPCMLYDGQSERIFMFYCYSPAGIGLQNANAGTGYDSQGRKLLYDREDRVFCYEARDLQCSHGNSQLHAGGSIMGDPDGSMTVTGEDGKRSDYVVGRDGRLDRKSVV